MSKKLIIKDADFSENALTVITDNYVILPLSTSGISTNCQRCGCNTGTLSGKFCLYVTGKTAGTWHTYIADVSQFIGRAVQVKYTNGYAASITANGAFLNSSAPTYEDGWTPVGQTNLDSYMIEKICQVDEDESNVELTKIYTIPNGAKWLMWCSKTQGEAIVLGE